MATVGALSHLVEAASALADLQPAVQNPPSTSVAEDLITAGLATAPAVLVKDEEARKPIEDSARNKREIFPERLMAILNDPSLSDIITWLPHGRSFVIIRPA